MKCDNYEGFRCLECKRNICKYCKDKNCNTCWNKEECIVIHIGIKKNVKDIKY